MVQMSMCHHLDPSERQLIHILRKLLRMFLRYLKPKLYSVNHLYVEPGYSSTRESSPVCRNPTDMTVTSLLQSSTQPVSTCHLTKDGMVRAGVSMANNCYSNTESSRALPACKAIYHKNFVTSLLVMPDFAQVYSFLGGAFDPNTSGHLRRLKAMDPIDVETVLIMMRNLAFNLTSPEFKDHHMAAI